MRGEFFSNSSREKRNSAHGPQRVRSEKNPGTTLDARREIVDDCGSAFFGQPRIREETKVGITPEFTEDGIPLAKCDPFGGLPIPRFTGMEPFSAEVLDTIRIREAFVPLLGENETNKGKHGI